MSEQRDLLFKIYRFKNEDDENWNIAVEDCTSHDVDPIFAAGVAYALFARYLDSVDESIQNEFQQEMIDWFSLMVDNGMDYVEQKKKFEE